MCPNKNQPESFSRASRHTYLPQTRTKATLLLGEDLPIQESSRSRKKFMEMHGISMQILGKYLALSRPLHEWKPLLF